MQLTETFAGENNLKNLGQLEKKSKSATDDSSRIEDENTTTQSVTQTFAKPTCSSDELKWIIFGQYRYLVEQLIIQQKQNGTFSFQKNISPRTHFDMFHVDVFKGLSDNLGCKVPVKGKECSKVFDSLGKINLWRSDDISKAKENRLFLSCGT